MPIMPELTTYKEAESWLLSITDYERLLGKDNLTYNTHTFDLDRFRQQLRQLGDPQKKYAVIHVAGTKGKGSTCAFLESALRHCGFRTGLYTSPHLYRFTERIRVNGDEIPDEAFCSLIQDMGCRIVEEGHASTGEGDRSFRTVFEILTAAAFQHFADSQVDVAIVETGLGGRLDSTNVFDEVGAGPLINVITAIGLDHTAILGNTLEAIAGEKAGILRGHARTVIAAQVSPGYEEAVHGVLRSKHRQTGSKTPLVSAAAEITVVAPESLKGSHTFRTAEQPAAMAGPLAAALASGLAMQPSLEGAHQRSNAATALLALREFETELATGAWPDRPTGGPWPCLEPESVVAGIEHTFWPGRFSVVESNVPVVIDGAHCSISAAALANACRARFGEKPAILITGFLRDKSGEEMLEAIKNTIPVAAAIALPPPSPRALSADHITSALTKVLGAGRVQTATSVEAALIVARELAASNDGYVVVFGSLYLVGPAFEALKQPASFTSHP